MSTQIPKSLILVCLISIIDSYSSKTFNYFLLVIQTNSNNFCTFLFPKGLDHLRSDTATNTLTATTQKSECVGVPELYLCAKNMNQGAAVANYFYTQHHKQIYQKAFMLQHGTVGNKSFYQTQDKEFAIWWCPTGNTPPFGFWNLDFSENINNNSPCRGKVFSEMGTKCPWHADSLDTIPWKYYEPCSDETYFAQLSLYTCNMNSAAFALSQSIITIAIALAAFIFFS